MWLNNSSIGRKVVMSISGIALVLFLTFHACMNVVALISADGYNAICKFLGSNWYAVAGTLVLVALIAIHFVYAIILTLQNRKARGQNRYAVSSKPDKVEWASQNMFVLGVIILLGLCLHLYDFWYNMMCAELAGSAPHVVNGVAFDPTNGAGLIAAKFGNPIICVIYLIWFAAIWFHLSHGFWSALQTLGWNGKVWFNRWRCIGIAWVTIVMLLFACVAIVFGIQGLAAK